MRCGVIRLELYSVGINCRTTILGCPTLSLAMICASPNRCRPATDRNHEGFLLGSNFPSVRFFYRKLISFHGQKLLSILYSHLCFFCDRDQLPNDQNFPILFYGVIGKDMCEPDSMSFYNPIEIAKILELIQHLLSSKLLNVQQREIGVIAPFRKQVSSKSSFFRRPIRVSGRNRVIFNFNGLLRSVDVIYYFCRPYFKIAYAGRRGEFRV